MIVVLLVLWLLGFGSQIAAAFSAHTLLFILALIFLA
jgi:hypothetical protein